MSTCLSTRRHLALDRAAHRHTVVYVGDTASENRQTTRCLAACITVLLDRPLSRMAAQCALGYQKRPRRHTKPDADSVSHFEVAERACRFLDSLERALRAFPADSSSHRALDHNPSSPAEHRPPAYADRNASASISAPMSSAMRRISSSSSVLSIPSRWLVSSRPAHASYSALRSPVKAGENESGMIS